MLSSSPPLVSFSLSPKEACLSLFTDWFRKRDYFSHSLLLHHHHTWFSLNSSCFLSKRRRRHSFLMKTIGMTGKMSPLFSEFSKCFAASAINYYVICFHAIKFSSQVIGKEKHRDRNSCKRKGKKVRESDPSSQESSSSSCVFLFRSLSFSFFSATSLKRQCEV